LTSRTDYIAQRLRCNGNRDEEKFPSANEST
jgi:hypothetical protein